MEKSVVEYPSKWSFRVIGSDESLMRKAVESILGDSAHSLMVSNASKTGKYISLNLETVVRDEGHRNQIYEDLKAAPPIKMVL
jgi:putative lipoic acid-binding regulatory protein